MHADGVSKIAGLITPLAFIILQYPDFRVDTTMVPLMTPDMYLRFDTALPSIVLLYPYFRVDTLVPLVTYCGKYISLRHGAAIILPYP